MAPPTAGRSSGSVYFGTQTFRTRLLPKKTEALSSAPKLSPPPSESRPGPAFFPGPSRPSEPETLEPPPSDHEAPPRGVFGW